VRLAEAGRREEGLAAIEQAVTIHRELAARNRDAWLPDLATSLNNLSVRLAEAGRREEGLAAIEQAVTIHRELAARNRDAWLPNLVRSLRVKAWILRDADPDGASELDREADRLDR